MSHVKQLYPSNVEPRKRRALKPDDVDKVGAAVLTLAKELWVVKDRQALLEEVLRRHKLDVTAEIDKLRPDGALEAKLAAERQALVKRLMQDLTGDYEPLA